MKCNERKREKRLRKAYTEVLQFILKTASRKEIEKGHINTTTAQRKYGIQARLTVVAWLRKYGNFDWGNQTPSNMSKTPEQVWVSDIAYIGNRQNPIYLALITDAYSKKIVGYDVSASLDALGCVRALKLAIKSRDYSESKLIHHSDRGLQYCSNEYQEILSKSNIKTSMTESYDPYANAVAERVNGILKPEFLDCYGYKLPFKLMKKVVWESIKIYNNDRPHYSCYMKTPNQMHAQKDIRIRTYKSKKPQE